MKHEEKLERIVAFLKERESEGSGSVPLRCVRKTVSHQVPKPEPERKARRIDYLDISNLDELLDIDERNMTCTAEPGLTFSDLVRETLKRGLVPATVPELKTITIGGAVAGCSVESMSYERGGFHDSCLEYEIATASGEVLRCEPEGENALLFQMAHGTFGTLGLITKLKFKLLPAKPFVRLSFERHESLAGFVAAARRHAAERDADFIDGLAFGPASYTLCLGSFVSEAPYAHAYDWMGIYHRAAATREEDYLSTYDYFFRYDADCHWIARNYGLENPIIRFLFGKLFLSSTRMLRLAKALPFLSSRENPDVVLDVFVPASRAEGFTEFFEREIGHYPLWIVPYRIDKPYPWLAEGYQPKAGDELYLDLAIYGFRPPDKRNYYRLIEEKLKELRGIKTLISHNFYERDEFWTIWNRGNYDAVKRIADPNGAFGNLYDKTHRR